MFFPYRDDNPHTHLPAVTLSLIVANTFIFLVFAFSPDYENIVELFGFTPARFNLLTLFTSIFLHGSIMHLAGNMWFLWLFGDNLEDKFGRTTFLIFYLFSGIVASLIHSIASPEAARSLPCIGASGAISAVMGGYIVLFPKAKVNCVFWFLYRFFFIKLSAFVFLGFWFLEQLFSGAYASISATEIAYGAHIGGFLYGVGMSFLVKKFFLSPQELLLPEQKLATLAKKEESKEIDSAVYEEEKEIKELDDYKE
jgi:membrane associated rhomboid family serine protease